MRLRILTPPTCVGLRYGRIVTSCPKFFLASGVINFSGLRLRPTLWPDVKWICLPDSLYVFNRTSIPGLDYPDASLHTQTVTSGTGILTCLPSVTPFGLTLGTDLPCADELNAGNLRFSARLILTVVIATYAGKVFSTRSTLSGPCGPPFRCVFAARGMLLYHPDQGPNLKLRYHA
jgi:hypothetical protein